MHKSNLTKSEKLPSNKQDIPPQKTESVLQERELVSPEKLSEKEASKKLLAQERQELAAKIFRERKENKDRMAELKVRLEILRMELSSAKTDWESNQKKCQELFQTRTAQVNSFAGRIQQMLKGIGFEFESDRNFQENTGEINEKTIAIYKKEEILKDEIENLTNLLESDNLFENIKDQLSQHYAKAEKISQEQFEQQQKSVENSMIRNNVFILHTLTDNEIARHNENSPVSSNASLEDDLDINISLEPSLSTTSVSPGKPRELFQEYYGNSGLIIGGGEIYSIDPITNPSGIKKRGEDKSSLEEIEKSLQESGNPEFNEVVVDNPKIFGLFKSVDVDKDGSAITRESVAIFKNHIDLAHKKGIPQFILTPDRRVFEYISIDESGKIQTGMEISPEEVARGKAGLPREARKKIGEEVVSKYLFRNIAHQHEAKNIVSELAGENVDGKTDLTAEEYIEQLRKYPEELKKRLSKYPKSLLSDRLFMLEAAKIDPAEAMLAADRKLKTDQEFIKSLYRLISANEKDASIFWLIPDGSITKELALIAMEHGDDTKGFLPEELFNDPEVRNKLIQNLLNIPQFKRENEIIDRTFDYRDSAGKTKEHNFNNDPDFLREIREKYEGIYKIDPYDNKLLVTKINSEN